MLHGRCSFCALNVSTWRKLTVSLQRVFEAWDKLPGGDEHGVHGAGRTMPIRFELSSFSGEFSVQEQYPTGLPLESILEASSSKAVRPPSALFYKLPNEWVINRPMCSLAILTADEDSRQRSYPTMSSASPSTGILRL